MSPLITVKQGGSEIPPGVYPVTLVTIEGPKTIVPNAGPNAGKEVEILSWNFAVDEGEWEGEEIEATTSTSSGPRSKLYGFLTALFSGKPPSTGDSFEAKDLCGRRALATIDRSESGWPRIANLGAMPASMLGARVAAATGAPVTQPGAPAPATSGRALRQTVAAAPAGGAEMPF
jgi:hypothetical protein